MSAVTDARPPASSRRSNALKREVGMIGLLWASMGSIIGSGWPTLILMPPMPDSSDAVAFSLISSTEACRKPPEVL